MSEARSDGISVDTAAALAASAFKAGDLVEVTHPIYSGRGQIVQKLWLPNLKAASGGPGQFLTWLVHPLTNGEYPGMVDIIDPMYGIVERGRSMRVVREGER